MNFNLIVSPAVSDPLARNVPYSLSLPVNAQFAMLPFTATAGQSMTLNVNSIVTYPSQPVYVAIRNASNIIVAQGSGSGSVSLGLANLAAGPYQVQLSPFYGGTATAVVTLQ